jgi:hypothetical protein
VHVQHPPEVTWLAEPEWSDGDVRRNLISVVVSPADLADVPVTAGQQEHSTVITNRQRGETVPIKPHRPERLGHRFVQPVGIRAFSGPEVDMKRPSFLVIPQGDRCIRDVDVPEFIRNDVRSQGCQVRAIVADRIKPVFREEHNRRVRLHPGFRSNDAHFFRNPLQGSARGRVAIDDPDSPRREAEQVLIQAGNDGQRPGTDIRSQR